MKRIRCPKCEAPILFDDEKYQAGCTLVFECPECSKQFKLRVNTPQAEEPEESPVYGRFTVIDNIFHLQQTLLLRKGLNIIGRHVKGTSINCPITTNDPSIDTKHCQVEVKQNKHGEWLFILKDCQSNTGTFVRNNVLGLNETLHLDNDEVVTIGATTMLFEKDETAQ